MAKALIYIHGKGGNAKEAEHYRPLFPDCTVMGLDYAAKNPKEARAEFAAAFDDAAKRFDEVSIIAVSLGAYFSLTALGERPVAHAYFISPVVDMAQLIRSMMAAANVTEDELKERGSIPTDFGETLDWDYYEDVLNHPVHWTHPTDILVAERDELIERAAVEDFAKKRGAALTVMPGGEHWFHTDEEMAFLDAWLKRAVGNGERSIG